MENKNLKGGCQMKMKVFLAAGVLAAVLAVNLCAFADQDEVVYRGNVFCAGVDNCQNFANWGITPPGYVVLYEANGRTISDYLWVNFNGLMTFESDNSSGGFAHLPPPGIPFLGGFIENGLPQEVDFLFPGFSGSGRTLFIESKVDTSNGSKIDNAVPEPSTLLLVGPAALFLLGRARRFLHA
jgi:hypothetical protein